MHSIFTDTHCATLDGATRSQPFGSEIVVWKVNGHMFAAYTEEGAGLSLRVGNMARVLRQVKASRPIAEPYMIGKGWVLFAWETPPDVLRTRIDESYRLVLRDFPSALPRPSPAD